MRHPPKSDRVIHLVVAAPASEPVCALVRDVLRSHKWRGFSSTPGLWLVSGQDTAQKLRDLIHDRPGFAALSASVLVVRVSGAWATTGMPEVAEWLRITSEVAAAEDAPGVVKRLAEDQGAEDSSGLSRWATSLWFLMTHPVTTTLEGQRFSGRRIAVRALARLGVLVLADVLAIAVVVGILWLLGRVP